MERENMISTFAYSITSEYLDGRDFKEGIISKYRITHEEFKRCLKLYFLITPDERKDKERLRKRETLEKYLDSYEDYQRMVHNYVDSNFSAMLSTYEDKYVKEYLSEIYIMSYRGEKKFDQYLEILIVQKYLEGYTKDWIYEKYHIDENKINDYISRYLIYRPDMAQVIKELDEKNGTEFCYGNYIEYFPHTFESQKAMVQEYLNSQEFKGEYASRNSVNLNTFQKYIYIYLSYCPWERDREKARTDSLLQKIISDRTWKQDSVISSSVRVLERFKNSLLTKEEFCRKEIPAEKFEKCIEYAKLDFFKYIKDIEYSIYYRREKEIGKIDFILQDITDNVELEDGSIVPYSLLDYYLKVKMDINELKEKVYIFSEQLKVENVRQFLNFYEENKRFLNNTIVRSYLPQMGGIDEKTNEKIYKFMVDKKLPLLIPIFKEIQRRLKKGVMKLD